MHAASRHGTPSLTSLPKDGRGVSTSIFKTEPFAVARNGSRVSGVLLSM